LSDIDEEAAEAWVRARFRPGNWLDIEPGEEIPREISHWNRTLVHMQQVSFGPEIRRRIENGDLPDDFFLWAAQLLQPHDDKALIRLNEEVRGVSYLRTGRPFEKGDPVLRSDLANLEYFDLVDDELDCGHFTIFWTGSSWVGAFDFRAGRAKCLSLIEKALAFVAAARLSMKEGLAEPSIDTLHTACELLAKTRLILGHIPAHEWKSHGSIKSAINKEGRLGNIDPAFLSLFNRLFEIRQHAKYATGYQAELPAWDEVALVETMAVGLKEAVAKKQPHREERA
jgi:hypothetical protein